MGGVQKVFAWGVRFDPGKPQRFSWGCGSARMGMGQLVHVPCSQEPLCFGGGCGDGGVWPWFPESVRSHIIYVFVFPFFRFFCILAGFRYHEHWFCASVPVSC